MQLFQTESSERSEKVVPSAFDLSAWIAVIYVVLTAACAMLYGLGEMSAFDAINYAMATLATGGSAGSRSSACWCCSTRSSGAADLAHACDHGNRAPPP